MAKLNPIPREPFRLSIEGDYWDVQLYMGVLYLWETDNGLIIIDWDKLIYDTIKKYKTNPDLFYLYCAGYNDAYGKMSYYGIQGSKSFDFENLSRIEIDRETLLEYKIYHITNPSGALNNDSKLFYNKIFFSNENGFFSTAITDLQKPQANHSTNKLWSGISFNLSLKPGRIALACGDDGLLDYLYNKELTAKYHYNDYIENKDFGFLSKRHTTFTATLNKSSVRYSFLEGCFLPDFEYLHRFSYYILNTEISLNDHKTITGDNRFFIVKDGSLYHQTITNIKDTKLKIGLNKEILNPLKKVADQTLIIQVLDKLQNSEIVGLSETSFGLVIETKKEIMVIRSDYAKLDLYPTEEVTRWRTYPHSRNYENQMTLIFDDRVEFVAYTHDFPIKEKIKDFGFKFENKSIEEFAP